ncbi:Flap structure-specific endonuclease [Colletotrichum higginsianum IMI 349063]|uniref:Flap structure-specific endonuclease n=1 Tax=Colletotrichum higginsianum (strain IMI 349063) TaxID=759273 RepID=A0A1B7XVF8_COLHI|nr:Flap structure-specific endonuclease [Colletotrichum higginsianum IMI 349063]OBR03723.1 Flap structure-specific endonuclease [Colletotrichum higginsianum IMI 349063]
MSSGGTNPAIRTLFYRLVRLLSLGIHPIFVFDGPHKPAFKRNKRSGRGDGVATAMAKRVTRLFGFPVHDAPGEAEAECALLQQKGIVDAVLSEDVDTIMFGCTRTLRNWTAEGTRGSKTPTHVSLYDVNALLSTGTGLDREGMVLVALMSGGDYLPEGVPGCGVKLACEAAKAGFGKSLCRLKIDDDIQFEEWRAKLRHELRTNESGFFRVRHKALSIPDEFPSRQVLRHYTHPVVSNSNTVNKLKTDVNWGNAIDVQGLRYFVQETFDWVNKAGAVKLTRVLSPGLLDEVVSFDRQGLALNSDDDLEATIDGDAETAGGKTRTNSTFDPNVPELIWLPETLVKISVPLTVEDWEEKQRSKALPRPSSKTVKTAKTAKTTKTIRTTKTAKKSASTAPHEAGALDKWVQITKTTGTNPSTTSQDKYFDDGDIQLPPLARSTLRGSSPPLHSSASVSASSQLPTPLQSSVNLSKQSRSNGKATAGVEPTGHLGAWAHVGSQHMPRITKSQHPAKPIILSSSPIRASSAPTRPSLSPPSPQHIIDLSGPDDATLIKASKSFDTFSSPSQPSTMTQLARGPSPALSGIPSDNKQSMKQTRMDSFVTNLPDKPLNVESLTHPNTRESNGALAYISASQTVKPSSLGYNDTSLNMLRITKPLARWIDYDDDDAPPPMEGTSGRARRMAVPRKSVGGFFKVIDMSDEHEKNGAKPTPSKRSTTSACRQSEVSIIDLTGDDE